MPNEEDFKNLVRKLVNIPKELTTPEEQIAYLKGYSAGTRDYSKELISRLNLKNILDDDTENESF